MSCHCSEYDVGLHVVQYLVVAKEAVFWHVTDAIIFNQLIISVVEHLNDPSREEINCLDFALVGDNGFSLLKLSTEQRDNKLVGEAPFALIKEVFKFLLKVVEQFSLMDQLSLHLWSHLLVE